MFNYECKPVIKYPVDMDYIPLLDSGFYFHPKNPTKLITRSEVKIFLLYYFFIIYYIFFSKFFNIVS